MRLALAQINPTIGDLAANRELIESFCERAAAAGAEVICFPELSLTGYPPKDLLMQQGFIDDTAQQAAMLREATRRWPGVLVVVGAPLPVPVGHDGHPQVHGSRRGITNSLLAYRDGTLVARYDKRLLPTYDVFDENRYFVPGSAPAVCRGWGGSGGHAGSVGLSICEDLWRGEDVGFAARYPEAPDPVTELVGALKRGKAGDKTIGGPLVILNPSASPFVMGKGARHHALLRRHAMRHGVYVAAVNQVGGNDELVFDGRAAVFDPRGELIACGSSFREDLVVVDLPGESAQAPIVQCELESEVERLFGALVLGVRDYCRKTGFKSVLLGLSGGVDSAVTAVLAAAALGPENVLGVGLPSRYSSQGSIDDAAALAERLRLRFELIPIEPAHAAFHAQLNPALRAISGGGGGVQGLCDENLQSRIRGTSLMALSNSLGRLLLTTGNKSELAVGYCTLYGDMNGGLAVLSDVTKQWVYRLARWMNEHARELGIGGGEGGGLVGPPIPESTITKPPSAELRPDQTDQDTLPPYDLLDDVIERYVERRQSVAHIAGETGYDGATVERIARLIDTSEFKRKQAATGIKVTGVAFGSGRRVPIAQRYRQSASG
ncbi:MAG: NAD+ synthase [Phycisphaerales bacterium]|nr:NAD+ synthase [Phycisphaerales bacterium]